LPVSPTEPGVALISSQSPLAVTVGFSDIISLVLDFQTQKGHVQSGRKSDALMMVVGKKDIMPDGEPRAEANSDQRDRRH
jgi:hypothetical protein